MAIEDSAKEKQASPPPSEWAMAAVGLLLTLGLLGYLLYEETTDAPTPPDIRVDVREVQRNGEDFLVLFLARNLGGEAAASVVVEGEIRADGKVLETSDVTLNYIPAGAALEGGLFFTRDPAGLSLDLRALGYTRP